MKTIIVKLEIDVPENATDKDIKEWLDVEFCGWNSMSQTNPCIDKGEVTHMEWKHE